MPMYKQANQDHNVKKFIDFDKYNKVFYDNIYLGENKIVIKIPILFDKEKNKVHEFKIDDFNLIKYIYLLGYD